MVSPIRGSTGSQTPLWPLFGVLLVAACTSVTGTTPNIVGADLILIGKVVTMTDAGLVEALAVDNSLVVAAGDIDSVMSHAGPSTPVIDLGDYVAYPGFVDAHAHWLGDKELYGADTLQEAVGLVLSHGWTSIAELFVDPGLLDELVALDGEGHLKVRVDGYLAVPASQLSDYVEQIGTLTPSDHLQIRGVKLAIDNGGGWGQGLWEAGELVEAFTTAHEAGWQIASHTVTSDDHQMVLDAFETVLGGEPNLLRHRIEHAVQVTDEQLQRIADMGLVVVGHTAGLSTAVADPEDLENLGEDTAWLNRYRDFVEAGIRFASASDAPWANPDLQVLPDLGRPQDLIASGMDGQRTDGTVSPPYVEAQTLTFEQALRSVTIDAAYAIGADDLRGHLAPGTYGDLTILSGDMDGASPDDIRQLRVVATIVGGRIMFCDEPALCG